MPAAVHSGSNVTHVAALPFASDLQHCLVRHPRPRQVKLLEAPLELQRRNQEPRVTGNALTLVSSSKTGSATEGMKLKLIDEILS